MATRTRSRPGRAPAGVQRVAQRVHERLRRGREHLERAFDGDRPLVVGLLVLLAAGVLVISAPLNSYLDQRDRVVLLEQQLDVLDQANGELSQRADDLGDPEHQELIAREAFGYIRPGEIGYVVVPPEQDPTTIGGQLEPDAELDRPWWRSAWERLTSLFG